MRPRTFLVVGLITIHTVAAAFAQASSGAIRGEVRDGSDAVVPGVTVELAVSARVIGVAVTGARGDFSFDAVPAGPITLRMTLEGFQPAALDADVAAGSETIVSGVLRVAPLSERVVVRAPAPPPPPPPPPPEPEYRVEPVRLADLESVCGPAKADPLVVPRGTLGTHRLERGRVLFRMGDEVTLNAAPGTSFVVGQNLVARRYFRPRDEKVTGEQTTGVVQIVIATAAGTLAVVIHSCGELRSGDLLMPFRPEPTLAPEPAGVPAYTDAARIMFGGAGELMGAPGRLMVIDRGRVHGIRQGQRLTLFRGGPDRRTVVGEAVVMAVRDDSARIRVERAGMAVWLGDLAAPHRLRRADPGGR